MLGSTARNFDRPTQLILNGASPHARAIQIACPFIPTGNIIYDASGYGRNGATVNSPPWVTDDMGVTLSLTAASSQTVQLPLIDGRRADLYVSCWMYLTSNPSFRAVPWQIGDNDSNGFQVQINSSGNLNGGLPAIGGVGWSVPIPTGRWHHTCLTIATGNVWSFYLNGVLAAGPTTPGATPNVPTTRIEIGNQTGFSFYLTGRIADFRVGYYTPTATEVWSMYDPATRWDLYRRTPTRLVPCQPGPFPHHLRRAMSGGMLEVA